MSTGLMSCVRENSPPVENGDEGRSSSEHGRNSAQSPGNTPNDTDTQKRRRFHPLRNLRRIFRRKTVSHAEPPPTQTHNFGTASSSTTDTTVSSKSGGGGMNMSVSGGYLYLKRDDSSEEYNRRHYNKHPHDDESSDMDRDITDSKRSFSEGRLIDSDVSREHLSQSHDSVFSDSATASSLSIVLKNELTDAFRKRGIRRETSEEDLGLPQSPITPNRKEKIMHHSQGSLSILSITSSDIDEEHSSMRQSATFDSSTSSGCYNKTFSDISHASDEVDLDLSSSSRLSHSAAKHKLAVRPKKKGPTRPGRSKETTNVLPSTPEVNEDVVKHINTTPDITDTPTKIIKSQSLPRETDPKSIHLFAFNSSSSGSSSSKSTKEMISKTPQKTTIYVNKNISKSDDFEKSTPLVHNSLQGTSVTQIKEIDDGAMKKFWSRNEVHSRKSDPLTVEEEVLEHKSILQINSDSDKDVSGNKKLRTGAAARQRVVPMEIIEPKIGPKSINVEFTKPPALKEKPTDISPLKVTKPIPIARTSITSSARISVHKSNEDLLSRSIEKTDSITSRSTSPPKTSWQEQLQLKAPSIVERTVVPDKNKDDTQIVSPKRNATVEKSKSFRSYTDTSSIEQQKSSNLPSLPNLLQSDHIKKPKLPFNNLAERYTELKRSDSDNKNNKQGAKFEINDFNLVKGQKEENITAKKRNLVLKGVEELPNAPSTSANISQIEENIDKLMKSGVTTLLKSTSIDRDDEDLPVEIVDSKSESTSTSMSPSPRYIGSPKMPSSPKTPTSPTVIFSEKKQEPEDTEVVLREKRVSSVLERFEAKSAEAAKFKKPFPKVVDDIKTEAKPPKPPISLRLSNNRGSIDKLEPPSSPTKSINDDVDLQTSIINKDNDDRKVILQRRTSVSEERLKFERRISGGDEYKSERKKSQSEESVDMKPFNFKNTKRSTQTSDEEGEPPSVQFRKKSITESTKKSDDTPELIKVFARRSLKIHADDEDKIREEIAKMQKIGNVDSDKENQSSSEEKLDKLAPTELISTNNQIEKFSNNNNSVSNDSTTVKTTTVDKKDSKVIEEETSPRKSITIPSKPFGTPSRYSNVANYRASQPFSEVRKNLNIKSIPIQSNNNNNGSNNQDLIKSTTSLNTGDTNNRNNNTETGVNVRHTIATSVPNITTSNNKTKHTDNESEVEFKGILQRKAEWEKRAKGGFK